MEPLVLVCNLTVYIFGSGGVNCSDVEQHCVKFQFGSPIKVERSKKADVVCVAMKRICSNNEKETAIMTCTFKY